MADKVVMGVQVDNLEGMDKFGGRRARQAEAPTRSRRGDATCNPIMQRPLNDAVRSAGSYSHI